MINHYNITQIKQSKNTSCNNWSSKSLLHVEHGAIVLLLLVVMCICDEDEWLYRCWSRWLRSRMISWSLPPWCSKLSLTFAQWADVGAALLEIDLQWQSLILICLVALCMLVAALVPSAGFAYLSLVVLCSCMQTSFHIILSVRIMAWLT